MSRQPVQRGNPECRMQNAEVERVTHCTWHAPDIGMSGHKAAAALPPSRGADGLGRCFAPSERIGPSCNESCPRCRAALHAGSGHGKNMPRSTSDGHITRGGGALRRTAAWGMVIEPDCDDTAGVTTALLVARLQRERLCHANSPSSPRFPHSAFCILHSAGISGPEGRPGAAQPAATSAASASRSMRRRGERLRRREQCGLIGRATSCGSARRVRRSGSRAAGRRRSSCRSEP
jgi:hypothetical protein